MKVVEINEYVTMLKELVTSGKEVNLRVSGGSMTPFLGDKRDMIIISPVKHPLKRGDMVFYQRASGQYVMHRIHHIDKDGMLHIVGDAQTQIEHDIAPEQVWGIVTKVIRKGKLIDEKNFWWWFFEKIWIRMVPVRGVLMTVYRWGTGTAKRSQDPDTNE